MKINLSTHSTSNSSKYHPHSILDHCQFSFAGDTCTSLKWGFLSKEKRDIPQCLFFGQHKNSKFLIRTVSSHTVYSYYSLGKTSKFDRLPPPPPMHAVSFSLVSFIRQVVYPFYNSKLN